MPSNGLGFLHKKNRRVVIHVSEVRQIINIPSLEVDDVYSPIIIMSAAAIAFITTVMNIVYIFRIVA